MDNLGVTKASGRQHGPRAATLAARWTFAALALGLLAGLLTGCGEPTQAEPGPDLSVMVAELHRIWDTDEEVLRAKLLSEIGSLGQAHPELIIPGLVEQLRTERRSQHMSVVIVTVDFKDTGLDRAGRKAAGVAARDVWLRRMRMHFPSLQVNANFRAAGKALFGQLELNVVRTFADDQKEANLLATLGDVLSRSGALSLMPVVTRPGTEGAPASLWDGDGASYDAFVSQHEAGLREAFEQGDRRLAGEGRYRLVLQGGDTAERKLDPVVLYHAAARDERFTNLEFSLDGKLNLQKRENVLAIQIGDAYLPAFDALCSKHKGRQLALVFDEQAEVLMPMPPSAAVGLLAVLGPMGVAGTPTTKPQPSASDRLLFRLVKSAQPGRITAPIRVVVKGNEPDEMLTPISACLVSVGARVVPYLEPLQADGGKLSQRVRWIRGEIRRLAREPGR